MKLTMKYTLLVVLTIFSLTTYAQYYYTPAPPPPRGPRPVNSVAPPADDQGFNPTGYLTINIGYAAPLGGFGSNIGTNYGNFALPGTAACVAAGIPLANTNIGVSVMYGNYDNPFNLSAFTANVAASPSSFSDTYYSVQADDYSENVIMGGLFYTWPIHRLSLDFRAMAGVMFCTMPEVIYAADAIYTGGTQPSNDFSWDYAPSRSTAFAYDVGAGLRYKLRRNVCLAFNVDYLAARANFNTLIDYIDDYNNEYITPTSGTIPFSFLNVSIGVGYQFK